MKKTKTLIEVLYALRFEKSKGVYYISGENNVQFLAYGDLYNEALYMLYNLKARGFKEGQEAILQLEDSKTFLSVFWGCLLGGIIPVPISLGNQHDQKLKLISVWNKLSDPRLITDSTHYERLNNFLANDLDFDIHHLLDKVILCENLSQFSKQASVNLNIQTEDTAYIQFSSGSTGNSKGVVLTHENLITNTRDIAERSNITQGDKALSWMPLTHDMGLICFHFTSLLNGIDQFILPTSVFIRRPLLWMQYASDEKISLLYSPNFGYQYFLNSLGDGKGQSWDLSNIRLIYNGAEPISYPICEEFIKRLKPFGIRDNVIYPGYGLAEASVAVSLPDPDDKVIYNLVERSSLNIGERVVFLEANDGKAVKLVETGYPIASCQVRIYNEGEVLPENTVGHIQIKGGNVTKGYYNNSNATSELFTPDKWCITGDLGFLREGRLTITGRFKNLIVINGQNFYPHDIESLIHGIDGLNLGMVAACGIRDVDKGEEELVIFILFKKSLEQFIPFIARIKSQISNTLGLPIKRVIPVRQIPKTTSGKVQYFQLIKQYENGRYDEIINTLSALKVAQVFPNFKSRLQEVFLQVIGIKPDENENLFSLGINSLQINSICLSLEKDFGVRLIPADFFKNSTINNVVAFLENQKAYNNVEIHVSDMPEYISLTDGQSRLWLMDEYYNHSGFLNIVYSEQLNGGINLDYLSCAFNDLLKRHKILTTAVCVKDGKPYFKFQSDIQKAEIEYRDYSHVIKNIEIIEEIENLGYKPFDIAQAPLIRLGIIKLGDQKHILVLSAHHIISDGWSTGVLISELSLLYRSNFMDVELSNFKLEFWDFNLWVERQLSENAFHESFWLSQLGKNLVPLQLPYKGKRDSVNTLKGKVYRYAIDYEVSENIIELSKAYGTSLFAIYVTLINILMYRYSGQEEIVIGTCTSGRNKSGFENMVGYFLNTIILKNTIRDQSFLDLNAEVERHIYDALTHQLYPLGKVIDGTAQATPFNVLFLFQNFQRMGHFSDHLEDLEGAPIELTHQGCFTDLQIELEELNGTHQLSFVYKEGLFDEWQITSMCRYLLKLIQSVLINPTQLVKEFEIFPKKEIKELIPVRRVNPVDGNVMKYIDEMANMFPEKIAVIGKECITYQDLKIKSDQLAAILKYNHDVRNGDMVGVMVSRSEKTILLILAILKSGACYLPIDTEYPLSRVHHILKDSELTFMVIEDESQITHELKNSGCKMVILD